MRAALAAAVLLVGCVAEERLEPTLGTVRFVIPGLDLPDELPTGASNNNVSIALHEDRLFLAWRTAPTHFASGDSRMHVMSSLDLGETWTFEATWALDADVREPLLLSHEGRLYFSFFEAGTNVAAFEPHAVWRTERTELGVWTEIAEWGDLGEVPWDARVHGDDVFMTSYFGTHYDFDAQESEVEVRFYRSTDAWSWEPVSGGDAQVYFGGASEAAFGWDDDGTLWSILRNEDGDTSGFGSLLCSAKEGDWGTWDCPEQSDPERYDSPRMFEHGGDVWLVARRDIDGPYDQSIATDFADRRWDNLTAYSARPKRTALYRIDRDLRAVEHVVDLPSAGDTAFPSVVQLDDHRFLVANYTSPPDDPDRSWLEGQGAADGTQIYLQEIRFEPAGD